MRVFSKLFRESVIIAFQEIMGNRLRAFLSLLGITIGIFCIISVLTAVDSLEANIRGSLGKLGDNVLYVQKFPWNEDPSKSWWKYISRPIAKYDEYKVLNDRLTLSDGVAMMLFLPGKTIKSGSNSIENVTILSVSHEYNEIKTLDLVYGRYFTQPESQRGAPIAIVGAKVAEELFPRQTNIVGKSMKIMGREVTVVGILKKEGEDIIGWSADDDVIVPYNFIKTMVDLRRGNVEPFIAVKAKPGVTTEDLRQEIRSVMRNVRKLRPVEEDNFAVNELSLISGVLNIIFGVVAFAGFLIGGFSILVGGFGIANIMFVSVKERTNIIGIKKALGAKRTFILLEFLVEAVVLCLLGGLIGLIAVMVESYVLGYLMRQYYDMDFDFLLTAKNVSIGLSISIILGIIFGFIPAFVASRMKPVDAIRSK
ncbi:MAG: ABC transporter permease [Chitinophagales bacterium]|nr:ABC transporter permease [Chitinophagales bacterium]